MSSYKGWLKITWLLNVIVAALCNCMYTQLEVHLFMWTVRVRVCLWLETAITFCFHRWIKYQAIFFFILFPQPDYFATAEYWHSTGSFYLDADTG